MALSTVSQDEGGEGHDRASLALNDDQKQLATAVFNAIKGKAGVHSAMLMINGGVIAFDELRVPRLCDLDRAPVCFVWC